MKTAQVAELKNATSRMLTARSHRERAGKHPAAWYFEAGSGETVMVRAANNASPLLDEIVAVLNARTLEIADWVREVTAKEEDSAQDALDQLLAGLTNGPQ